MNPPGSSPTEILVTVLGGYLGAGKTTLVNHLLRRSDQPIAVIVNDFGSIAIDADLIDAHDGETITLENGCICCSMVDGFAAALDQVLAAPVRPARLVVEASGVGDPAEIAAYGHGPGLRLAGVVTVVDGVRVRKQLRDEYIGDTVAAQVVAADLIVANKADLVVDPGLVLDALAARSSAPILAATHASVDPELVWDLPRVGKRTLTAAPASSTFRSWSITSDEPMDRAKTMELLAADAAVVRAKGVVRFMDAPEVRVIVHRVEDDVTVAEAGQWRGGASQLVFIATNS